ncbi:MAG: DUF6057 family protein [Prevotella sp.]|nr:DUF6057 family protein [Prevotella sp.]
MRFNIKNGTTTFRVVCAVLFLLFVFLYVFEYQADILAITQHVLSKGQTHYDRTIGAIIITLVLWLIQLAVYAVSRLNGAFHALTYFPSLLLLGILTDISPNIASEYYLGNWLWGYPLLLIVFALVVWLCRQYETIHLQDKSTSIIKPLWGNLTMMLMMFLMVCGIGNSDKVFHYRMHIEEAITTNDYASVSEIGYKDEKTDSSLTLLRIWTLSKNHELGEKLFEYPLVGGSDVMLPNGTSVKLMMVPETKLYKELGVWFDKKMRPIEYLTLLHERHYATSLSHDWLLCAYLLDGNLDLFVKTLPKFYNVRKNLPKHYREALTLYMHQSGHPIIVYRNNVMEADFEDFQALRLKNKDTRIQYSTLRDSYGKTYWFYYYTLRNKI